jgi:hypothetical protein
VDSVVLVDKMQVEPVAKVATAVSVDLADSAEHKELLFLGKVATVGSVALVGSVDWAPVEPRVLVGLAVSVVGVVQLV